MSRLSATAQRSTLFQHVLIRGIFPLNALPPALLHVQRVHHILLQWYHSTPPQPQPPRRLHASCAALLPDLPPLPGHAPRPAAVTQPLLLDTPPSLPPDSDGHWADAFTNSSSHNPAGGGGSAVRVGATGGGTQAALRLPRVVDACLSAAASVGDDEAAQVKAALVLVTSQRCVLLHTRWLACHSTCPVVVVQGGGRGAVQAVAAEHQATLDQRCVVVLDFFSGPVEL